MKDEANPQVNPRGLTPFTLIFSSILIASLSLISCGKKSADSEPSPAGVKFECDWESEEHWMVDLVVRNLARMAEAAGVETGSVQVVPSGEHLFEAGKSRLKMSPSCWDMASYSHLLTTWDPKRSDAGSETDGILLESLLTPTVQVLRKANSEVSRLIADHPSDPAAHERAAFLLGVLGIRENARCFSDIRPLLCRMTAHLAFAAHLRNGSEPGPEGTWATILHNLHMGRPKEALRLAESQPDSEESGRWKRAVKLLITGDWRRGNDLPDLTLIEAIAQSRALRDHRGNAEMIAFLEEQKELQATAEWSRSLAGPGKSVDDGHIAMRSAIPMELAEIGAVFPIGDEPTPKDLSKVLPDGLGDFTDAEVISKADWAAYFRRHFFAAASDVSYFAIRQWGEMDAAAEWEDTVLPYCKVWKGHELVSPLMAVNTATYQKRLAAARESILANPQLVPMAHWFIFRFPVLQCDSAMAMPDQMPWFRTVSPPATAHDPFGRIRFEGIHTRWQETIWELHQIDPWKSPLCFELADNPAKDAAEVKAIWGDLMEYSVRPLRILLRVSSVTPEERIDVLGKYAAIDPNQAIKLGEELVIAGRDDEAIRAFENGFENATNRVAFSNRSQWMIHHYKKKGDDEAAQRIADHNAEVYSHRGLESAMTLALVEGDFRLASSIADKIDERYNEPAHPMIAAWASGKDQRAAAELFPKGERKVSLEELKSAKELSGLRIGDNSTCVRLNGLRLGDIILAGDGTKIETFPQYMAVMCRKLDPEVTFIVRRAGQYSEKRCILPNRRLETSLQPME